MASIVVAGSAIGIGGACIAGFLDRGDDVLAIGPDMDAIVTEGHRGRCRVLVRALDDPGFAEHAVAAAVAAHGGIDCLVVTAAAMHAAPLEDWSAAEWDRIQSVNLRLPFFLARAAAPCLAASADPSILLLSSTAARRGQPNTGPYQAGKAGVVALMRSLAAELGPSGIRVNCVSPGWIDTPFSNAFWTGQPDPAAARAAVEGRIPLRRQGTAAEVAEVLLFLASPAARYISGADIAVDGGDSVV